MIEVPDGFPESLANSRHDRKGDAVTLDIESRNLRMGRIVFARVKDRLLDCFAD